MLSNLMYLTRLYDTIQSLPKFVIFSYNVLKEMSKRFFSQILNNFKSYNLKNWNKIKQTDREIIFTINIMYKSLKRKNILNFSFNAV